MRIDNKHAQKFTCTLKGGKLPDGVEFTIKVVMTFNGLSIEEVCLQASSGQSYRVAMQATMRTLPQATLRRLALEGLTINAGQVKHADAYLTEADKKAAQRELLLAMSQEEREVLMTDLKNLHEPVQEQEPIV